MDAAWPRATLHVTDADPRNPEWAFLTIVKPGNPSLHSSEGLSNVTALPSNL